MKAARKCRNCDAVLNNRHKITYCTSRCHADFRYKEYIDSWKNGKEDGNIGIVAKNISRHLKRYLEEKYKGKCSLCDWSKIHPITGIVPLEIDHIDGNAENNLESNLRLICPNCHSLTPFYKNLNKGKGRKWRMEKYVRNRPALK